MANTPTHAPISRLNFSGKVENEVAAVQANTAASRFPVRALYLRIKTDEGVEGLYGPIDKEVAIVVDEQLKAFLIGKDALAQEKL